jgi:hypothetical protein
MAVRNIEEQLGQLNHVWKPAAPKPPRRAQSADRPGELVVAKAGTWRS